MDEAKGFRYGKIENSILMGAIVACRACQDVFPYGGHSTIIRGSYSTPVDTQIMEWDRRWYDG